MDNWHIDVICLHLEAVTKGIATEEGIKRLLINVPPGHMKSLIINVFWPAWVWLRRPSWRALFLSYDSAVGVRDSVKCRDLITSDWYQMTFQPKWGLKPDQNEKSYYFNTERGFRLFLTVGGANTGHRGDAIVVDDPINALDASNPKARQAVITWWDQAMSSRLNNQAHGVYLIIMQRLNTEDLAGHVLKRDGDVHADGGYDHVSLPSLYEPAKAKHPTSIGWKDPRTEQGELLFPSLFPRKVLDQARKRLGSAGFSGQHQQDPVPTDGNTFKPWWWRYWIPSDRRDLLEFPVRVRQDDELVECFIRVLPYTMEEIRNDPKIFSRSEQSWDMAFKDNKTSSYVVGQVWGSIGSDHFLLDQVRDKLDLPGSIKAVENLSARWPQVAGKAIEDKANGPAVMQMLRGKLSGLLPVMPYGSKEARASAVAPLVEAGDVYLPHPGLYAFVDPLQTRLTAFPNSDKDEVDTLTQYLQRTIASGNGYTHTTAEVGASLTVGDLDQGGDYPEPDPDLWP